MLICLLVAFGHVRSSDAFVTRRTVSLHRLAACAGRRSVCCNSFRRRERGGARAQRLSDGEAPRTGHPGNRRRLTRAEAEYAQQECAAPGARGAGRRPDLPRRPFHMYRVVHGGLSASRTRRSATQAASTRRPRHGPAVSCKRWWDTSRCTVYRLMRRVIRRQPIDPGDADRRENEHDVDDGLPHDPRFGEA